MPDQIRNVLPAGAYLRKKPVPKDRLFIYVVCTAVTIPGGAGQSRLPMHPVRIVRGDSPH